MKDNRFIERETPESIQKNLQSPLTEGEDFYVENGLYVFTASYLKRRGYCCGNNCRHCPYPKET